MAFVWQSVRQEDTPPEQSEDSTLTSHISVKLRQLCVTPSEKNPTEVTVSKNQETVCDSGLSLQAYVTRGSGVEAVGEIYRASVYGIKLTPQADTALFVQCVCEL